MAGKSTFWSDFKAFITKGNVMDMAVGVVIGGSFGKIVTGLVTYIINPFIGIFTGQGKSLDSLKTVITEADADAGIEEVAILWGTWIQTILDFLITAICIFIVMRVIMKAKKAMEAKKIAEEEAKAAAEKAEADKAAEEAKAAAEEAAKKQAELEASLIAQGKILAEINDTLKKIEKK